MRPLIKTTTVGVPVATTDSTRCCCTPVSASAVASRNSPLVQSGMRPDLPPTASTATSARRAASTAAAMPLVSEPSISQPLAYTTVVCGDTAERMPASGDTMGTK
jgi:hypothetical protein